MSKRKPYCRPLEAGLPSEAQAVARRLGKLFDAFDGVNRAIVDGAILEDIAAFRERLKERLEAEGWTVSYMNGNLEGTNRCHVYAPGSPAGKRIRIDRNHGNE